MMRDVVEFDSPMGPIGSLVDRVVLTRYLTGLLVQRNQWLDDHLS